MEIIKFFYDLETTGLETSKHAIHQLSAEIEVDGETVEEMDLRIRPFEGAEISQGAMSTGNVTKEQIMAYRPHQEVFKEFHKILSKYIDPYDKGHKMFLVGFNNARFDDAFLRVWFQRNHNRSFDMYFWSHAVDVMSLASEYLLARRQDMRNFKLATVAGELGIEVDKERLHEAGYDIFLTKKIYRIVTGRDEEW